MSGSSPSVNKENEQAYKMEDVKADVPTKKMDEEVNVTQDIAPQSLEDVAMALSMVRNSVDTRKHSDEEDWKHIERTLRLIQSLCLFHNDELIKAAPIGVFEYIIIQANSLRSTITKTALNTIEAIMSKASQIYFNDETEDWRAKLDVLVSLLATKSVNEKRFLAESAKSALEALAKASKSVEQSDALMKSLLESSKASKNIKMAAVTCNSALTCMDALSDETKQLLGLPVLLSFVLEIEGGRSTEARPAAQKMVREIHRVLGEEAFAESLKSVGDPLATKRALDIVAVAKETKASTSSIAKTKPWLIAKASKSVATHNS